MVSIVIPTYNEAERIIISLEKLAKFLADRKEEFEVIVVDDASSDNTSAVANSFKDKIRNLTVLRLEKSPFAGKGLAVNKGVLAAKGEVVLFTDADFSTPIEEIDKLLEKISAGADIAIGSRAVDRSLVKQHQNFLRELMGRSFNLFVKIFTVRGIADTQCGFKAFKMPACRSLFKEQKIFDFGFDVELLFSAQKKGLKIAEVPVLWYNDARSTVNPIVDSTKMFIDLVKIRLYHGRLNGSFADKIYYLIYHYRTFWRFCVVGVTNTAVDIGVLFILTRSFGIDKVVANRFSVEVAVIWSFLFNNFWTFSERDLNNSFFKRFLIFQTVALGSYALNQTLFVTFTLIFNIYDLVAKLLIIPFILVFDFFVHSRWTFREKKSTWLTWASYLSLVVFLFAIYFILIILKPWQIS